MGGQFPSRTGTEPVAHARTALDSDKRATEFVKAHARSYLFLRFDDVEELRANQVTPTRWLIEQGLAFAEGKDKLLVSCRAGKGEVLPWPI